MRPATYRTQSVGASGWGVTNADDMRHAAAIVAAKDGPGERRVYVASPADWNQHPNGAPICVHSFRCVVSGADVLTVHDTSGRQEGRGL